MRGATVEGREEEGGGGGNSGGGEVRCDSRV